jgi:hypothetical protein
MDAATFAVAIAVLAAIRLTESEPEPAVPGSFRREFAAGVRHLRRVPLLAQITLVTACAFSIIGLNETIIFAVVGQGLRRPPTFFGIYSGVQGAGSVAAGIALPALLRWTGTARMIGLSLAWFALGSAAYLSDSVLLVMAGAFADGAGVVWLVAVTGTAIQRFTPPRLQGRAQAAWTMLAVTPQTVSIAVGAALISYLSYRVMLLAVIAVVGACAAAVLIRPAPEPLTDAAQEGAVQEGAAPKGGTREGGTTEGAAQEEAADSARPGVLLRREAQGAVEADDLAVEVVVLGDALDHGRVLRRAAHPPGVRDLRAPVGLDLVA